MDADTVNYCKTIEELSDALKRARYWLKLIEQQESKMDSATAGLWCCDLAIINSAISRHLSMIEHDADESTTRPHGLTEEGLR